jgi:hypothetical protein
MKVRHRSRAVINLDDIHQHIRKRNSCAACNVVDAISEAITNQLDMAAPPVVPEFDLGTVPFRKQFVRRKNACVSTSS